MELRHLKSIMVTLTRDSLDKVTHGFINSRLDYCNAFLCGLSESSISKLQHIENVAARLLTDTKKFDHKTPVVKSLAACGEENRIQGAASCISGSRLYERYVSNQLAVPRSKLKLQSKALRIVLLVLLPRECSAKINH